jgi:hypothetical protein
MESRSESGLFPLQTSHFYPSPKRHLKHFPCLFRRPTGRYASVAGTISSPTYRNHQSMNQVSGAGRPQLMELPKKASSTAQRRYALMGRVSSCLNAYICSVIVSTASALYCDHNSRFVGGNPDVMPPPIMHKFPRNGGMHEAGRISKRFMDNGC